MDKPFTEWDPAGDGTLKPRKVTGVHQLRTVDTVAIEIVFIVNLINNSTGVIFSIGTQVSDTQSQFAGVGESSVQLRGEFAGDLIFGLSVIDGSFFGQQVSVRRPPVFSADAGCLILPAVPVAVIYQPATANASTSFDLRQTSGAGTIRIAGVADIPQATPLVKDITTAVDTLHTIATAAEAVLPEPYGGIAAKILNGAAAIVGTFKPDGGEQVSISITGETDVTFVYSQEEIGSSDPAAGSPDGDAIMFIRDVAFAYVVIDRQLMLIPLGSGPIDVAAVASLRPDAANPPDLPAAALALLLAADPVASGTARRFGSPDPARFTYCRTYDHYDDSGITFVQSHTETTDKKTTSTSFTSDLSGRLLYIEQNGGASSSTSFATSASLMIKGPVHLPIYFDKLYGTYAFLDPFPEAVGILPPQPSTIFQGQLNSRSKVLLARQIVSLQHGPELLTTVTDSQGRYRFTSAVTGDGMGTLFLPSPEVNAPPTTVSILEPRSGFIATAAAAQPRRTSVQVTANENGSLSAFLIGQDTALYCYDQDEPNGAWGEAQYMAGTWPVQLPVVTANENGSLSAFLIGQDTALYRYDQDEPNGAWNVLLPQSMRGTW